MRDLVVVSMCALVLPLACKSRSEGEAPAASVTKPALSAPAVVASVPAVVASVPALDEAAESAFVKRWEAAQNEHDYEAYQALYAARFTGVKRVGGYTKRFDRAAWLLDRKPMLKPGVSVVVSEQKISGAPGAVRVIFLQEFSAPGFRDKGQKELFLTRSAAGFAISREEMLESQVAGADGAVKSSVLGYHRDGPVLEAGIVAASLKGAPRLLSRGAKDAFDVAVSVASNEVGEASRAWLGREVTVYGTDGAQCKGTVKGFEVRVKAEPHFGMRQAWDGEDGQPKASTTQIATQIWQMARDEERFVVGVLDHDCQGTWAAGQALTWTAPATLAPSMRAAAVKAFQALPQYRELQARFAKESGDSTHAWETVDGELVVSQVGSWLVVSARSGAGCDSFAGTLTGIWQADGEKLGFRGLVDTVSDVLRVHGAVDDNADGVLELLAGPSDFDDQVSIVRVAGKGFQRRALFKTSFWDCGC